MIKHAVHAAVSTSRRLRFNDGLQTFDQAFIDSAGAFLIGELERLDQRLNMPLIDYKWSRDIDLRTDVAMADEFSSFTNSTFAAAPGVPGSNKSWIGQDATAIPGIALEIGKTPTPLSLWGRQIGWTIPELESAIKLGRPVDSQKMTALNIKHQMDIDEQVYIGDTALNLKGMLNHAGVTNVANAVNGGWAAAITANAATASVAILADINELLYSVYQASAFAKCPGKLGLPPKQFSLLVSTLVSTAGSMSILTFLEQNSLALALNGKKLEIVPIKWATGTTAGGVGPGTSGKDRMVAYTKSEELIRFPLVPLQRTPLEYRGIHQLVSYFGKLGAVECPYPETVGYRDGI